MSFSKEEVYTKLKNCLYKGFIIGERGGLIVAQRKGFIPGIKNDITLTIAVSPQTSEYLYAAVFGYYCRTAYTEKLTARINENYKGKFVAKSNVSNEFFLETKSKFSSLEEMIDLMARDDSILIQALSNDKDIIEMSKLLSKKSNI